MKHSYQPTFLLLFLILLSLQLCAGQVLSTLNFKSNNVVSAGLSTANFIGLSMYFPQLMPYLNNSLFKSRVSSADFNNGNGPSGSSFHQTIHMPKGYKYNCSSTIYSATVSCLKDFILDTATTKLLTNYVKNLTYYRNIDIGFDIEKSNFSNSKYQLNFKSFVNLFYPTAFNIQLIDYGDLIGSIYNRTYTVNDLISDYAIINSSVGVPVNGPGITEAADWSWVNQISTLTANSYFTFTFRCTVFPNSSQATISNLMSQNYTGAYLKKRLTNSTGATLDLSKNKVGINQIRLTNDSGVMGVTNSFASALWALDISMQFAAMKGNFINFYNPLTSSNQSIFGDPPFFEPTPLLYGLLFAAYTLRYTPQIQLAQIVSGTSQSIKAYGIKVYNDYRVLIINKDANPNASGVVKLSMDYSDGIRCYYLTAPNLSSTSGVSFAGMSFVGNSSDYTGQFIYYEYQQVGGSYLVNLNYSQAVLCQQNQKTSSYYTIPRGRRNYQPIPLLLSLSLAIISCVLLL